MWIARSNKRRLYDLYQSGHSRYLPCLRVCMRCLEHNQKWIKRVFVAVISHCEEENKAAFRSLKDETEQNEINREFVLLTPIPDAPHVGKSLKAEFSNWYLKLGNERSNITTIRSLRNKSTSKVQTEIRKYSLKNDFVRNRDRQDPSSTLALARKPLLNFISSLGATSSTLILETRKFTCDNRKGMYNMVGFIFYITTTIKPANLMWWKHAFMLHLIRLDFIFICIIFCVLLLYALLYFVLLLYALYYCYYALLCFLRCVLSLV